jgi:hypothetical protein
MSIPQIQSFTTNQIQSLSNEQIQATVYINNYSEMSYVFTTQQLQALTCEQLQSLTFVDACANAGVFNEYQIQAFTTRQIQEFTPTQINDSVCSKSHQNGYGTAYSFTTQQIQALTCEQIQNLLTTPCFPLYGGAAHGILTESQIQAFTTSQIQQFSPIQINNLAYNSNYTDPLFSFTSTQIQTLTSGQIADLSIPYLGTTLFPYLTPSQISQFSSEAENSYLNFSSITSEQFAVMTANQIGAITDARLNNLSDNNFQQIKQKLDLNRRFLRNKYWISGSETELTEYGNGVYTGDFYLNGYYQGPVKSYNDLELNEEQNLMYLKGTLTLFTGYTVNTTLQQYQYFYNGNSQIYDFYT